MSRLAIIVAGFATFGIFTVSNPAIAQTNTGSGKGPNSIQFYYDADIEGDWKLKWKSGGIWHQGYLKMYNNNYGKLWVSAPYRNYPTVKQEVKVQQRRNSFILQGYNPTHPDYSPDTFRFYLGNRQDQVVRVENCSSGPCRSIEEFYKVR